MRPVPLPNDTIDGFEDARRARLEEGLYLWAYADAPAADAGAAYLLGYSIEIALKAAYFRVEGLAAAFPIDHQVLNTARHKVGLLGVTTPHESFHSILFWCEALRALRSSLGSALPPVADASLRLHARSSYDRWWVGMRYQPSATSAAELDELVAAASWFDSNYPVLYR
jgi:hypothetical protein